MPQTIQYTMEELQEFIKQDPCSIIALYGGEPLLEIDTVKTILNTIQAKHFVINTNGFFLEQLEEYIHRFDTILLSIDGRETVTDGYRGKGCYKKVMQAVDFVKKNSYSKELIARMAVSKKTDIYKDVTHLLSYFPLVHWQLDVIWSPLWELNEFSDWVETSYKPGVLRLLDEWIEHIHNGTIKGIVPFMGIMTRILHGGSGLACQAGNQAMAITTDGKVLACPIAPEFEWNVLGDFQKRKTITIGKPCIQCSVYDICGGRCLFSYKEQCWGTQGFNAVCKTTQFVINELKQRKKECKQLKELFHYPLFNNTTEIIP